MNKLLNQFIHWGCLPIEFQSFVPIDAALAAVKQIAIELLLTSHTAIVPLDQRARLKLDNGHRCVLDSDINWILFRFRLSITYRLKLAGGGVHLFRTAEVVAK